MNSSSSVGSDKGNNDFIDKSEEMFLKNVNKTEWIP